MLRAGRSEKLPIRPMLIVCPTCASCYDVDAAEMPLQGRQVRCLRCRTVWQAELSQADKLAAAAAAIAEVDASHAGPRLEQASSAADAGAQRLEPRVNDGFHGGDNTASERAPPAHGLSAPPGDGGGPEMEAPPIVPAELDHGGPAKVVATNNAPELLELGSSDAESTATQKRRRKSKRRELTWPLSWLHTAILALLFVDAVLLARRTDVVRALPQTASFYSLIGMPVNLRGLALDGVVSSIEQHEGVPALVVTGNVVNISRKASEVPRLKLIVRNAARQELFSWGAVLSRRSLPPGEKLAFRTSLASPPPDAHDVVVRFLGVRDVAAGLH
jgi:predicted Zn finger-like uncharacterized protein